METHQYPGVYQEETLPSVNIKPTVTCLPLFIGYTEKSIDNNGKRLAPGTLSSINSFAEFEQHFGQQAQETLRVVLDASGRIVSATSYSPFYLHASMKQYFANGGGTCKVLSVGHYPDAPDASILEAAIDHLPAHASFTMVAIPDAVSLAALPKLQQKLLQYCQRQDHCFAILDLPYCNTQTLMTCAQAFRSSIGQQALRYGAAFIPWLEISPMRAAHYVDLEIKYTPGVAAAWNEFHKATRLQSHLLHKRLAESPSTVISRMIPPSGTIIGLFHANDRDHGIWKMPTQVAMNHVQGVSADIPNTVQESLNIDRAGKSINAIRKFIHRGISLWGGRTLAGNDNEWRYIASVRTSSFVISSVRNYLLEQAFESNDEPTWHQIRLNCHNFLSTLWKNGGLVGEKLEHAFFINVGLNQTMTNQDIAEGQVIIVIGLSLFKPAEFMMLSIKQAIPAISAIEPQQTQLTTTANKRKVRARTSPINVTVKAAKSTRSSKPQVLESS